MIQNCSELFFLKLTRFGTLELMKTLDASLIKLTS